MKSAFERKSNETAARSTQSKGSSHLTQELSMDDQVVASSNTDKVRCINRVDSGRCRYKICTTTGNVKLVPDTMKDRTGYTRFQSSSPVSLTDGGYTNVKAHVVQHHFPSPILSCVESPPLVGHVSHVNVPNSTKDHVEYSSEGSSTSKAIQDVHISARLMEEFMELASANTKENLETCGILGAFLKNQTFYVTTLIIPKQESTSNSCQAINEEEIHAIQDGQSLFPVGWIHTHPSQTCFLSSIDLHTQYSYQVMLPEAIAIVMAPADPSRSYGIFRLTDPGGITILRECCESGGFHLHPQTCSDGSPIYESCSHVYINPNLRFEVIDLRSAPSP
ncbi:AMSH-like ubiquitin thioesterase 2 isoform X1 [Asparagus officinalis]|uniref:AMSH-like ubiquitin thioesterase 2 isoform X1 n=1 Tax=Asparagus officinalis TaxID=4686 RepID=UPI00098DE9D2|nr:AMSH-like ubiquitin thioesterase 2 isoform X1 [Asparagus officinalis]XP_020251285.1 AMSH-like ubiquitin thioesterase 2 isoform X1 [Asparagus officinalis]